MVQKSSNCFNIRACLVKNDRSENVPKRSHFRWFPSSRDYCWFPSSSLGTHFRSSSFVEFVEIAQSWNLCTSEVYVGNRILFKQIRGRPPVGVHGASAQVTSASGGLAFRRVTKLPRLDEGLVFHAHSNGVLSFGPGGNRCCRR